VALNSRTSARTTQALLNAERGCQESARTLAQLVYEDLRSLASRYARNERPGHPLNPTALVHEAYIRLIDGSVAGIHGQKHFKAIAALTMRRVLIDFAESTNAQKRGGDRKQVTLHEYSATAHDQGIDLLDLEQALGELMVLSPRQSKVVELRFFAGLSIEEVSDILAVSERSVRRDWTIARAWLKRRLSPEQHRGR